MTSNEGLDIYNLYKEKLEKIPVGDVFGIYNDPFPVYILCKNKQCLKLRKKRKVMVLPHFQTLSKEDKFSRILLYYPMTPETMITTDRLGKELTILHSI